MMVVPYNAVLQTVLPVSKLILSNAALLQTSAVLSRSTDRPSGTGMYPLQATTAHPAFPKA